ncbi:MAG: ATP-binding protein [Clostridiales bacterium]|nr:ATP-binding protein [Clostridiales bacterium]
MELKRKAYDSLIEWKKRKNHKPLIVEGLRQVGKSYIVDKFARENYKNVITFDFRYNKKLREIFSGDLDVDTIVRKASLFFIDKNFGLDDTVLIFEEIGDCPLARTALKSFALDGRYDIIATGSLLGVINYRRKQKISIPTGYEEYLKMTSLDFEEFLWANGVSDEQIAELKKHTTSKSELDEFTSGIYRGFIKDYMAIGGLPEVVTRFVESNRNYIEARNVLERLITDYRSDFGRFVDENGNEEIDYRLQNQLNMIFDSIPRQLAREQDVTKFKYSEIKKGGRASEFEWGFEWLEKAGLVLRCHNVKALERPLSLNAEDTYFKAFISDPGLLMAMYPIVTLRDFLSDNLDSRKGALYENLSGVFISKAGFPLYYYADGGNHLEIDFLLEGCEGLILYESKSTNGKIPASRAVMEGKTPYKASACYKIIERNFGEGAFFTSVPHFCASFLLDEIQKSISDMSQL